MTEKTLSPQDSAAPDADAFDHDVFLSHSSKDESVVRALAERLRQDGLRVWFGPWQIRPGDNIPARIEQGLESSHLLLLCMSASAFGGDWPMLESQTFRFRDPLNRERRFIPLRLDETLPVGSLAQFAYVDWRASVRDAHYQRLLETCRMAEPARVPPRHLAEQSEAVAAGEHGAMVGSVAFSPDGRFVLSGSHDNTLRLWDVESGSCLRVLTGHHGAVRSISWGPEGRLALSGSNDGTMRVWDLATGQCTRVLEGHTGRVFSVAWSLNGLGALSGACDHTLRLWDTASGACLRVMEGHRSAVRSIAWSTALNPERWRALSASTDHTVRLWNINTNRCLRVLEGHTRAVWSVAWNPSRWYALSGSDDETMRLWDAQSGHCLRVYLGHTSSVFSVAWSPDGKHALTGSRDMTVGLWEVDSGRCLRFLEGHTKGVYSVAWSPNGRWVISGSGDHTVRLWDVATGRCLRTFGQSADVESPATRAGRRTRAAKDTLVDPPPPPSIPEALQYTNAKILLVGDSGAGKTGLAMRLAHDTWRETESTTGAWATQWRIPVAENGSMEREIWLWDFGGQADQRLIHQIYMDETALAVLVFDPQRENLFDTLSQWDRDLSRAARRPFRKLLVAGRADAGGLRASRSEIEAFAKERGYSCYLETSAKTGEGCDALKEAILQSIQWENIPWRSSPRLFRRLREEIIRLKEEGRVLLRLNELRETLRYRLATTGEPFTDEQLSAVIRLLAGPGVVRELAFGSWVLLQPELLNVYAQAVIRTMRADAHELGHLLEERVLRGELAFRKSTPRLPADEERIVLLAMHQILVERELCLREHDPEGKRPTLLVFPSYYGRERPDLVGHPAVFVSYQFNGFIDDIYATLVVRLHHTQPFEQAELWRYAADFKTALGKRLGIKLTRRAQGAGELEVYFDPAVSLADKVVFSKYVHEHLLQKASDVERLRHYVCPHCETPVGNHAVARRRLTEGRQDILCVGCEQRVPLWDELEERFASPETERKVSELQEESQRFLACESRERALVGEVISTVALAGQISRELSTPGQGLDMEIEFKSDEGHPTGQKIWLLVRPESGIRTTPEERHVVSWRSQPFPVLVITLDDARQIRWVEIGDWLKRGPRAGERFDVMSVRRWRDRVLRRSATVTGGVLRGGTGHMFGPAANDRVLDRRAQ